MRRVPWCITHDATYPDNDASDAGAWPGFTGPTCHERRYHEETGTGEIGPCRTVMVALAQPDSINTVGPVPGDDVLTWLEHLHGVLHNLEPNVRHTHERHGLTVTAARDGSWETWDANKRMHPDG